MIGATLLCPYHVGNRNWCTKKADFERILVYKSAESFTLSANHYFKMKYYNGLLEKKEKDRFLSSSIKNIVLF